MSFTPFIERLKAGLDQQPNHEVRYAEMMAKRVNGNAISFPEKRNPKEGAVMILFYEKAGDIHFPLIQRPEYEGVHGWQMALPGGKVETGDSDLVATAKRETEEEIGVDATEIDVLGRLSPFYVGASNYEVLPVIGYTKGEMSFTPDPEEVAEIVEVRLDDLLDEEKKKEKILVVRGYELMAPYFDLNNKVVWGATAMMLAQVKNIIKNI